ncbi:pyrimidine reductase family protein [Nocardia sp. NBC_01329]|uniref:pyrimidine reductase family protein n=1 Tax=Nocardia sp. NBC_01329 TaxID=2903594 RepID=UPI002E0E1EDE|nr:pyrimidine reductase family protein [Nocardia sp. NBC_01329]
MQRIPDATQLTDLDGDELADLYAYPGKREQSWLRVNFVSSIDGAVTGPGGVSGALGTPADKRVFHLLRELCEVVLVGAGTVRAENYGGALTDPRLRRDLFGRGIGGHADGTPPPIAIVTASAALDPEHRVITTARTPTLILTTAAAPAERKRALADAGAEVIEIGDEVIEPRAVPEALTARGLRRVLCEGGPQLFGSLAAEGAVDELCLTTAPLLVGGAARRISVSHEEFGLRMTPAHLLFDTDGTMLIRWVRG